VINAKNNIDDNVFILNFANDTQSVLAKTV